MFCKNAARKIRMKRFTVKNAARFSKPKKKRGLRQKRIEATEDWLKMTERQIFSISPTLIFVKIGYGLAVLGAILAGCC